jgi:hypothetical protein
LPIECDGKAPATWQVGAALSAFRTTIVFSGAHVPVEQEAVSGTIGHFTSGTFGWSVTATAIVHGQVESRPLDGGGSVSGSISWLWIHERPRAPFVALTGSFGTALARATADDGSKRWWWATDLRGGAMVGKTFAKRVVPYLAVRAFGGPVVWRRGGERIYGGDRYHVTAGVGLSVHLPAQLDLSAELMPLGEQSIAFGLTAHR